MTRTLLTSAIAIMVLTTGCSINHPVEIDYDDHLVQYGSETTLPQSPLEAGYLIGEDTANHRYQFRAATVGYAHVWIVEFGKILDKTINADYVQSAFGKFEKGETQSGILIEFELESYEFRNYRAYTALNIKVLKSGSEVHNKTYRAEGGSQGGQMWVAGPFGMKNATLKSTKQSIDKILEEFINDINDSNLVASDN